MVAHGVLLAALAVLWLFSLVSTLQALDTRTAGFTLLHSAPYVLSILTGAQTGELQPYDRLLAVDGQPLANSEQFVTLLHRHVVGENLLVKSQHPNGQIVTSGVPVQKFDWRLWVNNALPLLFIALGHLLVGGFAFLWAPSNRAARVHLRVTGALSAMISLVACSDLTHALPSWCSFLPKPFVGAAGIELALIFPTVLTLVKRHPWTVKVPYLPAFAMLALGLIAEVPAARRWLGISNVFIYRELSGATLIYATFALIILLLLAYHRCRTAASRVVQAQAKITLGGAVLGYGPYAIFGLCVAFPASFTGNTYPLVLELITMLAFLIFPLAIAYAIARHRLFDIELVIRQSLIYGTVTAVLAIAFMALSAGARLLAEPLLGKSALPEVLATAGITLFFGPLRERIQVLVNRAFHRIPYDFRALALEFNDRIREIVDAPKAIALFQEVISGALQPAHVTVLTPGSARLVTGGATLIKLQRREVEAIALGPKRSEEPYLPEDRELVQHLGHQLAVTLENARLFAEVAEQEKLKHELALARSVQEGLLPKRLPEIPGLEVAAASLPAGQVGGDFYDVLSLPGERLGILIGDVSGKGIPAALLMSSTLALFRTGAKDSLSPRLVIERFNEYVCEHGSGHGTFVASCYAVYEGDRLKLTNAGMPKLLRNGVPVEAVGMPAGLVASYRYREAEITLHAGDTLVFCSDGWADAQNLQGEVFGRERLQALAAKLTALAARDQVAAFLAELAAFCSGAEPFDDRTIVVIRKVC
ncbi:MAG: SpoIIE family protein phosphatase [Cyanobacteria bacterium NC_groundwater_1444_Ag_S-0.65um_54_12]|nr:SpoIIE family protein phosphatase [Cyanobacteria bacterium NC_groundwater_1444_Ag_S-0.65um_54_12]